MVKPAMSKVTVNIKSSVLFKLWKCGIPKKCHKASRENKGREGHLR
jgi:hypothetical protein